MNLFCFPKNPLQVANHMHIEIVRQYIYIYKVIQIIVAQQQMKVNEL